MKRGRPRKRGRPKNKSTSQNKRSRLSQGVVQETNSFEDGSLFLSPAFNTTSNSPDTQSVLRKRRARYHSQPEESRDRRNARDRLSYENLTQESKDQRNERHYNPIIRQDYYNRRRLTENLNHTSIEDSNVEEAKVNHTSIEDSNVEEAKVQQILETHREQIGQQTRDLDKVNEKERINAANKFWHLNKNDTSVSATFDTNLKGGMRPLIFKQFLENLEQNHMELGKTLLETGYSDESLIPKNPIDYLEKFPFMLYSMADYLRNLTKYKLWFCYFCQEGWLLKPNECKSVILDSNDIHNSTVSACARCKSEYRKDGVPKFSAANDMDPFVDRYYFENNLIKDFFDLPELTIADMWMISIQIPFVKCYNVKGRKHRRYKGHVITFAQDIENYTEDILEANMLPRDPTTLPITLVRHQGRSPTEYKDFKCNISHQIQWLRFLINRHPEYMGIQFNQRVINFFQSNRIDTVAPFLNTLEAPGSAAVEGAPSTTHEASHLDTTSVEMASNENESNAQPASLSANNIIPNSTVANDKLHEIWKTHLTLSQSQQNQDETNDELNECEDDSEDDSDNDGGVDKLN